jgi:hypothetical protein
MQLILLRPGHCGRCIFTVTVQVISGFADAMSEGVATDRPRETIEMNRTLRGLYLRPLTILIAIAVAMLLVIVAG